MPTVVVSRPVIGSFSVPGHEVKFGPERGFPDKGALRDFVRGSSAIVSWVSERIDADVLDAAGPGLKVVANYAVGYDNIDLPACRQRGVLVANTPDAVTEGTADIAWALLLSAARRVGEGDRFARSGAWQRHGPLGPADFIGMPVSGRTLLIVGAGRIGRATAMRSIGWGMRVLYTARSPKPDMESAPLCAQRVELDEGLKLADFVSIHTPLTPETRHMIDARRLALMKPEAVLVNTSRGAVIDEPALIAALREKRIFAAGLDVLEQEPMVPAELAALENVVIAPHIGSANHQCRRWMTAMCEANVRAVLAGGRPINEVR